MPDKIKKIRGNDPRLTNQLRHRKGYRRIHLPDGIWEWKTNGYDVLIYSPRRKRNLLKYWDLVNMTQAEWDEKRWGNYCCDWCSGHTVLPSEVRNYIAQNIARLV